MEKIITTDVLMNIAVGNFGNSRITGTNLRTGNWQVIYAFDDMTFETLTIKDSDSSWDGFTLRAGEFISGHITAIKPANSDSEAIAYKRGAA